MRNIDNVPQRLTQAAREMLYWQKMDIANLAEQRGLAVGAGSGGDGGGDDWKPMTPQLRLAIELLRVARMEVVEQIRDELDDGSLAGGPQQ